MLITFHPMRRAARLVLAREGDTLILNGARFDFAPLAEGAILPAEAIGSDWFAGPVERIDGRLHLAVILPHGTRAPAETLFPDPLVPGGDGPVDLPPYATEEEAS